MTDSSRRVAPRGLPLATHAPPPPPPPPPPPAPPAPPAPASAQAQGESRWKRFTKGAGELIDALAAGSPAGMTQYAFNALEEEHEIREAIARGEAPPPPPSRLRPDGSKKGFWERFDDATDEMKRTYHRDGLLANPEAYAEADARVRAREERDARAEGLRSQASYEAAREASRPHTPGGEGLTREQYDRVVDDHEALARRMAAHPELFEAPPTGASSEVVTSVTRVSPSVASRFPELADDAGSIPSADHSGPSL